MFYELWILLLMFLPQLPCKLPPHIVIIVIDDLGENKKHMKCQTIYYFNFSGWNDVPWNNPDSLAVNLGNHAKYVCKIVIASCDI